MAGIIWEGFVLYGQILLVLLLTALQDTKKSFHLSIILQLDKTRVFLKHPGVKSRRPEHYVFVEIKRLLPDKIFFCQGTMRLQLLVLLF